MRLLGVGSVSELNARHVRPFKTFGKPLARRNADMGSDQHQSLDACLV
jgi:hypothetical protein